MDDLEKRREPVKVANWGEYDKHTYEIHYFLL